MNRGRVPAHRSRYQPPKPKMSGVATSSTPRASPSPKPSQASRRCRSSLSSKVSSNLSFTLSSKLVSPRGVGELVNSFSI